MIFKIKYSIFKQEAIGLTFAKSLYYSEDNNTMKRKYQSPKLTVHGSIETLTKATGSTPTADGVFVNGEPLSIPTDGSNDIIIDTKY